MNKHVFLWLIEIHENTEHVEFFGQEDKTKIRVGYYVSISIVVREILDPPLSVPATKTTCK